MAKGGDTVTTSTTTQDVPEWARPYYDDMLAKTKAMSEEEYVGYNGPRVAQDSADLNRSESIIRGVANQGTPWYDKAVGGLAGLQGQASRLGQQSPYQFSQYGGFQAAPGANQAVSAYNFGPARQFSGAETATYMSPYMDAVVGRQQENAVRQHEMQAAKLDASAVTAGAFGGSRHGVVEGMANEELSRQLSDIYAEGSQAAFTNAQQQFERDRTAQMTQSQRQAEELARVQGISVEEAARIQAAKAAELARVQAGQSEENRAQQQFQLESMGFSADMIKDIVGMQNAGRNASIQDAQLLGAQGLGQMGRDQAGLDIAYQDFLRQQGYPESQLARYSSILQGLPVQGAGSTSVAEPYNPMQEALGAGISALGLYQGLK